MISPVPPVVPLATFLEVSSHAQVQFCCKFVSLNQLQSVLLAFLAHCFTQVPGLMAKERNKRKRSNQRRICGHFRGHLDGTFRGSFRGERLKRLKPVRVPTFVGTLVGAFISASIGVFVGSSFACACSVRPQSPIRCLCEVKMSHVDDVLDKRKVARGEQEHQAPKTDPWRHVRMRIYL